MATMGSTPKAGARAEKWVALLGRRDTPTDGVEDYCTFLGEALEQHGVQLQNVRVRWSDEGWFGALRHLWRESGGWRDDWVLLQYTAMGWSRRGFPFGALAALYHSSSPWRPHRRGVSRPFRQGGPRWIDHLRGALPGLGYAQIVRRSDKSYLRGSLRYTSLAAKK